MTSSNRRPSTATKLYNFALKLDHLSHSEPPVTREISPSNRVNFVVPFTYDSLN